MKKKGPILIILLLISIIIVILIQLESKINRGTEYESDSKEIINGYKLLSVSAYNRCIGYELEDGSTKVGTYVQGHVYKYCYNSRYIGIQQIKPAKTKKEFNYNTINYYIIDTETDTVFPFSSKEDYDKFIVTNAINDLGNWIDTINYD